MNEAQFSIDNVPAPTVRTIRARLLSRLAYGAKLSAAAAVLLAAVASAGADTPDTTGVMTSRHAQLAAQMEAAAPTPTRTPAKGSALTADELKLWNDPAFKKRFVESYLAETEIEPRITIDERDKMQKVLEKISGDKMDDALAMLEKGRGKMANAVFDFTRANIYFQQEKLAKAVAAYQAAVKKFPNFRRAYRNLGLIHVRRSEFTEAAKAFTRVLELGGGDAVTYGLLGYAYASTENHLSAETAYRQAILLDPVTMDWKMGLARSLFKQERYAEAVALTRSLIADEPERADLWMLQANAYIGLKKPQKAAENYELIEQLGKSTYDSLAMLADIYVNEELYALAVDTYIRAMNKDPHTDPERVIRAAKVLTARGAMDETKRLIAEIEKVHVSTMGTLDRKDLLKLEARIAVAEGAGDDEARVLKKIVELDPLDGEALILLGQHSRRAGDNAKAIFYFERAASIEKFEADAKLRHAQLLVSLGKYTESLPLLRRAQTLNPRDNIQEFLEQVERVANARGR